MQRRLTMIPFNLDIEDRNVQRGKVWVMFLLLGRQV